jgi:hypothetical protein
MKWATLEGDERVLWKNNKRIGGGRGEEKTKNNK